MKSQPYTTQYKKKGTAKAGRKLCHQILYLENHGFHYWSKDIPLHFNWLETHTNLRGDRVARET